MGKLALICFSEELPTYGNTTLGTDPHLAEFYGIGDLCNIVYSISVVSVLGHDGCFFHVKIFKSVVVVVNIMRCSRIIFNLIGQRETVCSLELSMRLWYMHKIDMTSNKITQILKNSQYANFLGWEIRNVGKRENKRGAKNTRTFFWRHPFAKMVCAPQIETRIPA